MIRIRYFASIREALGAGEAVEAANAGSIGQLRDHLIAKSPQHAAALARSRTLRSALNQDMCGESAEVADGDEVAFFPPVTGG